MKKTFNINDRAAIVLTKAGADVINEHIGEQKRMCSFTDRQIEILFGKEKFREGDTYRSELWSIMHIFGAHIFMGCNTPFLHNEITLD